MARLLASAVLAACTGALMARHPDLAWLWLSSGLGVAAAWLFRGRPGARRMALPLAFFSLGLGWVGQGLLRHAALRGQWGIRGVEDPAAWPLLAVVLSLVALPGIPLVLSICRRATLAEDAASVLAQGTGPFVASLVRDADRLLLDVDPPSWVERWLSPTPSILRRITLVEAQGAGKETAG